MDYSYPSYVSNKEYPTSKDYKCLSILFPWQFKPYPYSYKTKIDHTYTREFN